MAAGWIELLTGSLDEKKRWRQYKARTRQLPENYRATVEAIERYTMIAGPGDGRTKMFEDLIDLFEQSAASSTPIREIVGDDPVEFVEAFVRNYGDGWRSRERNRLTQAIARAAGEDV